MNMNMNKLNLPFTMAHCLGQVNNTKCLYIIL